MVHFKSIAFLFALGLSYVPAQEQLFPTPITLWENQIIPTVSSEIGVLKGNGCKISPDGAHVIVTAVGGTVTSFDALSGEVEWEYNPPVPAGGIVRSHSQVVFTTPNAVTPPYMVYSVVENENSADAVGRVIALDMDGNQLWVSDGLDGVPNGSPLVSDDGSYVFLVHNANFQTVGYFTVLSAMDDGAQFYSRANETTPFAPPGIFHSPIEGNYDGVEGRGNTNDFIMWAGTPKPDDTTISDGNTFGFQLPLGFDGNMTEVGYFLLGDAPRNFQAIAAPTLTNQGLSAFYATTRSGYYGWNGSVENARGRFNRGAQAFVGFDRNAVFPGQAVFASPAVNNGVATTPDQPIIFGGTASTQFIRLNSDFTEQTVVDTSSIIKAEARVDPFDRVVYFVEEAGMVHQVDFTTIQDIWTVNMTSTVEGDIALNKNGYVLYVADTTGLVTALQVSEIPVTPSPTASPTANVTASPTGAPVVATPSPTPSPTSSAMTSDTPMPTGQSVVDPEVPTEEDPTSAPTAASGASSQQIIVLSLVSMVFSLLL